MGEAHRHIIVNLTLPLHQAKGWGRGLEGGVEEIEDTGSIALTRLTFISPKEGGMEQGRDLIVNHKP